MYMKKILLISVFCLLLFALFAGPASARGGNSRPHNPPPWAMDDWKNDNRPPAAPEPATLTLIGMSASGVLGFIIGKKKK